jgi:GTP-binding protein
MQGNENSIKIISAEYIKSFTRVQELDLEALAAIAFIGRSNVGKSSLINSLLNRKKLVKTSSTPGNTQLINYFLINRQFYFIDLPGYGFAKVPIEVKHRWQRMISDFLLHCPNLRMIVQLVDIRHKPSGEDIAFQHLVKDTEIPCLVVANKADKLKKSQVGKAKKDIKQQLNLGLAPLTHSALKKTGRAEIWDMIGKMIGIED